MPKKRGRFFKRRSVSKGRNISISRKLEDRKSIGRKGYIAESEPKGRSGPSLARARFGPLRPFGSDSAIWPFRLIDIFRPFDTLGLSKILPHFFWPNEFRPIVVQSITS
jgi:hypothetical protein